MNVKKIIAYIFSILLIIVVSYGTGRHHSAQRSDQYEERIESLTTELTNQADRNRELTEGLEQSQRDISELTESINSYRRENEELREGYLKIEERVGNLGEGVSEDIERVEDLIGRFDYYINQNTE
jgi:chromosome segregation ATPase